jgi:hypothetical protein
MDINQDEESDNNLKYQKDTKKSEKIVKINDDLFEIAVRKGLIEKNEDGYYFVGDYEELLAFINKSSIKSFEWLD